MILLSCCTEMEIKGGSLIGLFLTDWGRYFQALGSFWHRGSAAKLPFFKNYGLDCCVNPYKTFSAWSHIGEISPWHPCVKLAQLGAHFVINTYLCICFFCICVFVSMYLPFSQCISDFLYVLLKQQSWAQPFKSKIGQKFSQFLETRTQWEPADATSYYTC